MDNQLGVPSFSGVPLEELNDLAKVHTDVVLRVKRKNAKGAPQFVTSLEMPIQDLADIEERLSKTYGGGEYFVDISDPVNKLVPIKKFRLHIEGAPVAIKAGQQNEEFVHQAGVQTAPVGIGPQGQMRQMPMQQMYPPGYMGTPNNPPVAEHPPLWSMASDQMALKMNSDLKQTMNKLEREKDAVNARLVVEQEKAAAERTTLLKRLEDVEKQRVEDARRADAEKNAASLAALEKRLLDVQHAKPEPKSPEWLAMLPALVPIAVALVENNRHSQAAQITAQQESSKQMMQMMLAMQNKKDDNPGMLAAMMPLMLESMKQNSPMAKSEAMSAILDQQMGSLQMIGDMMKSMQGEEPSPMMQLAQQALQGLGGVMEAMRAQRAAEPSTPRLVHQGQVYGLPSGPATMPPPPMPQPNGTAGISFDGMSPDTIVGLIFASPQMPAEMKTDAWRALLLAMHAKNPINEVAQGFWMLLQKLAQNKALPEIFLNLDMNYETVLPLLLAEMPIAQMDGAYTQSLAQKLVSDYQGFLAARPLAAQPAPAAVIVTAPPEEHESDAETDAEDESDEDDDVEDVVETTGVSSANGKTQHIAQASRK